MSAKAREQTKNLMQPSIQNETILIQIDKCSLRNSQRDSSLRALCPVNYALELQLGSPPLWLLLACGFVHPWRGRGVPCQNLHGCLHRGGRKGLMRPLPSTVIERRQPMRAGASSGIFFLSRDVTSLAFQTRNFQPLPLFGN